MLSKIRNFFRKKKSMPLPPPPAPEEEVNTGIINLSEMFSTHTIEDAITRQLKLEAAIPVVPDTLTEVKTVSGSGMDFGGTIDNNAKSAFVFGQNRIPDQLFSWYVSHSFIGYQACGLIAQQWLINKACTVKGEDAVRNGYELTVNDGEEVDQKIIAKIKKLDKKFKVKQNCVRASKFNNVFGIRHILFVVESGDPGYYEKPFNPDSIKPRSYKGMAQMDPYWITPLLDESASARPESIDFYEPTYWTVSGQKIHKSHFVILRGDEVPQILKPSYIYGGLPLTQQLYERVYAAERTANEAPILAMTKRLMVWKMDLNKAVADPENFRKAIEAHTELRDNHGFLAAGTEEDVTQIDTALADMDSLMMTQYQLVAAIANVPATRLLETSPKGFNATGEYEAKNYQQVLETEQEQLLPIVEMHHQCLMASEITPKYGKDFEIDADWNQADMPTSKELAEINKLEGEYDTMLYNMGVVDNYEVRDKVSAKQDSGYNGIEKVDRPGEPELEESSVSKSGINQN